MKPYHFRFLTLIFCLFQFCITSLYSQRTIEATFKDGKEAKITFVDETPENIADWNIAFKLLGVKGLRNESTKEGTVAGPFFVDADYQKFLFNKKAMVNVQLSYAPIDGRFLEASKRFRKANFSSEVLYTHEIYGHKFLKNKKLSFTDFTGINSQSQNIYRLNTDVLYKRSFGVRGGLQWYQFPLDKITKYRDMEIRGIYAGNTTMLIFGISSNKFVHVEYTSEKFGGQKVFGMTSLYLDVLYALPVGSLFYGTNTPNGDIKERAKNKDLDISPLGFRFGGYFKNSKIRRNFSGMYYFELGLLPGSIKESFLEFGYALVIGPFRREGEKRNRFRIVF